MKRLEQIIAGKIAYINRPYRRGRSFNQTVEEDNAAIASAIVMIESLQ